jgi:hypothetical protein
MKNIALFATSIITTLLSVITAIMIGLDSKDSRLYCLGILFVVISFITFNKVKNLNAREVLYGLGIVLVLVGALRMFFCTA